VILANRLGRFKLPAGDLQQDCDLSKLVVETKVARMHRVLHMRMRGFAPVAGADARVLILGTVPGKRSLECRQYYAKRGNLFWPLMAEILGFSCDLPYESREKHLKNNRIALWDVCETACRAGSLDSTIRLADVVPNEFGAFLSAHKNMELICFNGSKAARIYQRKVLRELPVELQPIRTEILPSTSPAFARMNREEKIFRWQSVLGKVL
jgi:hypoxanthine-DNA glycosylase